MAFDESEEFYKEWDKLNEEYINLFDDSFPTIPCGFDVDLIKKCIRLKKSVYQLGYLNLDVEY